MKILNEKFKKEGGYVVDNGNVDKFIDLENVTVPGNLWIETYVDFMKHLSVKGNLTLYRDLSVDTLCVDGDIFAGGANITCKDYILCSGDVLVDGLCVNGSVVARNVNASYVEAESVSVTQDVYSVNYIVVKKHVLARRVACSRVIVK